MAKAPEHEHPRDDSPALGRSLVVGTLAGLAACYGFVNFQRDQGFSTAFLNDFTQRQPVRQFNTPSGNSQSPAAPAQYQPAQSPEPEGAQPDQPGYGPPDQGQPGYGSTDQGQPGYAPPEQKQQEYGAPDQNQSGYGAPNQQPANQGGYPGVAAPGVQQQQ